MDSRTLEKNRRVFLDGPIIEIIDAAEMEKRQEEALAFEKELKGFGVKLSRLTEAIPPKHTRDLLLSLAMLFLTEAPLVEKFQKEGRFPLKKVSKQVQIPEFDLAPWVGYLTAYVLLLSPNRYPLLARILQQDKASEAGEQPLPLNASYTGVPLRSWGSGSLILTGQGEFVKVKAKVEGGAPVVTGQKAPRRFRWERPFAALLLLTLLLYGGTRALTHQVDRSVVIMASGEVKADFNRFGHLVGIVGLNNQGKVFVQRAKFTAKDLDSVVAGILEEAYISESIRERDEVTLLISGTVLPEDFFKQGKTHDRVISYQLRCKINNGGRPLFLE